MYFKFFIIDFLVWVVKEICVIDGDCICVDGMIVYCYYGKCYCYYSIYECNYFEECGCDFGYYVMCDNYLCYCYFMFF